MDWLHKAWTFGTSVYDQRATIGASLVAVGTTMLGYDYHKDIAVPLVIVGTFLAAQGKPIVKDKEPPRAD